MADLPNIKDLPGLKARDIGKTVNGEGVAAQGPVFYRVTVEQFALDMRAVERQRGLEMVLGNAAIAAVMRPDEDVAKLIQKSTVFVGLHDAMALPVVALLGEDGSDG